MMPLLIPCSLLRHYLVIGILIHRLKLIDEVHVTHWVLSVSLIIFIIVISVRENHDVIRHVDVSGAVGLFHGNGALFFIRFVIDDGLSSDKV